MPDRLTSSRLKPIKKRGDRRYISATALKKRHAARPSRSRIPAMASVQLAQLIREIKLTETGLTESKLSNRGRSADDFIEAAFLNVQSIRNLLVEQQAVSLSETALNAFPKKSDRLFFSKEQAQQLGQAISTINHITLWDAFEDGLQQGAKKATRNWRAKWYQQQKRYMHALNRLRLAALNKQTVLAANCLLELSTWALKELPNICKDAGRASAYARKKPHTSSAHYGFLVSDLCRKIAMLSAAAALLCQRLDSSRTRESTSQVAERREILMRQQFDLWRVNHFLEDTPTGETVTLSGRLEEVQWEERPGKPVSVARLKHMPYDLLVPRKSLRRQGVAPNSYIWCQGKLKTASGNRYVEVDQEGPTLHDHEVWEDWLAVQVRPLYDLYPGSVQMAWEFPEAGHFGSKLDFLTRVTR